MNWVRVLTAIMLVGWAAAQAEAGMLSVRGGGPIVWDRAASSALSPVIRISLTNDTGPEPFLAAWTLGLKIEAVTGDSSGAVSIDPATLGYAPANVIVGNRFPLTAAAPAPGVFSITGADADYFSTLDPQFLDAAPLEAGLLDLRLQSSDASGTFRLLAVNDGTGLYTNWTDGAFDQRAFINVPFADGATEILATIVVVPEPNTLLLALLAAIGTHGYQARMPRTTSPATSVRRKSRPLKR